MIEELDLRLFKGILSSNSYGVEFSLNYSPSLFPKGDASVFAKLLIEYIKAFRTNPTRRTLMARNPGDLNTSCIERVWDAIDKLDYDVQEYRFDLELAKDRFQNQVLYRIQHNLKNIGTDDPSKLVKNTILQLQDAHTIKNGRTHIQQSVADHFDEFQARYDATKQSINESSTILTHYSVIDSVTGGLSPSELVIIGGETNAGKSQLLLNMAIQMWMQTNTLETLPEQFIRGRSITYFSLEMPYEECFDRFLARLAGVPQRSLASAALDEAQLMRVRKARKFVEEFQKAGYYFDIVDVPRNVTLEELELRYNDALLKYYPEVVAVDYMGLMHDPKMQKEQDWLKMGAIAGSLHEFSRSKNVIVLTGVQLTDIKRGSGKKDDGDQRVGVHRVGRSSHIMHHANLGIQIETRPGEINYPDLRYHIVKNRKGPLGQGNMIKNFANSTLVDVPLISDVNQNDITEQMPDLIKKLQHSIGNA